MPPTPECRLHREPFWKLVPLPGREITGPVADSISSVSQLRNVALGADLDPALYAHMTSAAGRQALAGARDQGYRRAIVLHYDHRCAFCGTRIVTAEGHTVVDAAHIVDIRNGMALCKLCHWSFDEGLVGVSEGYAVIVSRQLGLSHNVPGVLLELGDREIRGPEDRALWPDQGHQGWHRRAFRL